MAQGDSSQLDVAVSGLCHQCRAVGIKGVFLGGISRAGVGCHRLSPGSLQGWGEAQ